MKEESSQTSSVSFQEANSDVLVDTEERQICDKYRKLFLTQIKHKLLFKESTHSEKVFKQRLSEWHRGDP